MSSGGTFDSPLSALLSRLKYEELFGPSTMGKIASSLLKKLPLPHQIAPIEGALEEIPDLALDSSLRRGAIALIEVILEELKGPSNSIENVKSRLVRLETFIASSTGGSLFRQSAGATQRTADRSKIRRIGTILLNGALSWPREEQEREVRAQEMAEFTRIAEILTDTDIMVLNAIYKAQFGLIERYRSVIRKEPASAQQGELQTQWIQAVFQIWRDTEFNSDSNPLPFFAVHSALVRLESQGLIGGTTTQNVVAQVTSTPYGLLELGAQFVEFAVNLAENDSHQTKALC